MFEQDYIMRLIKEMVRVILKLLFHIDTDSPSIKLLEEAEDKQTLELLIGMVDDGRIEEAENIVYEITEDKSRRDLEIAILFYSYLNEKTDDFLEEHSFGREEIEAGLKDILSRYGMGRLAETFMQ